MLIVDIILQIKLLYIGIPISITSNLPICLFGGPFAVSFLAIVVYKISNITRGNQKNKLKVKMFIRFCSLKCWKLKYLISVDFVVLFFFFFVNLFILKPDNCHEVNFSPGSINISCTGRRG